MLLKNELFKYTLSTLYICNLHIYVLYICALLIALSAPVAHANSPCVDLVPSSSSKEQSTSNPKEQSASTPKEQSAPIHLGVGSESTPRGKRTSSLSSSSDTFSSPSPSKTPMEQTKDFESYIGELLENRIIGEPQLLRFVESLENGELINPISEEEARLSTASAVQRRGLQQHLDKASLDQKELLNWARATLEKRTQAQVSREETREETRDISQKLEFHSVERPARFTMKYPWDDKIPVTLTYPIEVQSTPVTQNQWVEIMGENPSHFAQGEDTVVWNFHGKHIELQPDHPVESVTLWSVLVFANRLSEKQGLPPAYDLSGIDWKPGTQPENGTLQPVKEQKHGETLRIYAKGKSHNLSKRDIYYQTEGYRLPTRAEQEYMLQGGRGMKIDSLFKNETDMKKYVWYDANAGGSTQPVGLLQPITINGKDFHEVYGNVSEWSWDTHKYPSKVKHLFNLKSEKNPIGPKVHPSARGGDWNSDLNGMSASFIPVTSINNVGFRLVRTVEPGDGKQGGGE